MVVTCVETVDDFFYVHGVSAASQWQQELSRPCCSDKAWYSWNCQSTIEWAIFILAFFVST